MKLYKKILFLSLFFIPTFVFADSGSMDIPIIIVIFIEAFVTLHMSLFVLKPLSNLISQTNSKKVFWILFVSRIIILLIFDFFITPFIAMLDFLLVFVGTFSLPIISSVTKKNLYAKTSTLASSNQAPKEFVLKCTKCGQKLNQTDKFCANCGYPSPINATAQKNVSTEPQIVVNHANFDPIYNNSEDKLLEEFINRELVKAEISTNSLIPSEVLSKKNKLYIIFSFLLFVFISLIFFHFPTLTYIIGIIILIIFLIVTRKYSLIKYLKKEIKSRPSEKISNIVMNTKSSLTEDKSKITLLISSIVSLLLSLLIFKDPIIMYEKVENGYAVRFYTLGLTNFTTAEIPETHNNEPIVSLRGNTFSNMPFLKTIKLPNTITEIRGQAFKNDISLVSVNIPNNLEYLGGGAFYNCTSIKEVELPNTLTFLGGEAFYNAKSLKSIKLSNSITEIRGNTFENAVSLESINIPDSVVRIGGHAFYNNISLETVEFTENSKLTEIGSSAFRNCRNLHLIKLPRNVFINSRAFKESPTIIDFFE